MNIYQNVHKQPHYFFGSPSKFMILNDSYSKYCFTWKVFIFLLRNFDECEEVETDETTSDMHVSVQSPQSIAKSAKVICSLDLLLQIFQGKCRYPACNDKVSTKYTLIGTSVLVILGSFIPHMIAMVYLQQISKLQLLFYYLATILQKFNSSQDF